MTWYSPGPVNKNTRKTTLDSKGVIMTMIENKKNGDIKQGKILLAHLPYWVPLVPPMGIAVLTRTLRDNGFAVKGVDLNVEKDFKELYDRYFNTLKKYIPEHRRGNFYHIGHDVLQQHMMAHINYTDEEEYSGLVKILIDSIFYNNAGTEQVREHIEIMKEFYRRLETYFLELFTREKPTVLGLTVYKGTLPPALFVYRLAKKTVPGIKTVMGGGIFVSTLIPGTLEMDTFLGKTANDIDKIMIGKGEDFMLKYLRNQLPDSQRVFTLNDLWVTGGEPGEPPSRLPDLADFDLRNYPYLTASASSGCLYKCSFCSSKLFFGEYRRRPMELVVEEMVKMHENYKTRVYFMTDALLNPIIGELAEGIAGTGRSLYFDGYFRVDEASCDVENTLRWRRGGFYRARLGVESGSQRILDVMDKQITTEQIRAALAGLAYAGIKPTAYFVIGHPGETEADFQQTLGLLEDIKNDIWQAECNPFYYYPAQPGADQWFDKKIPLYPPRAAEMLMMQTWSVAGEPSREQLYNRVFRFAEHCKKMGIPNPYSLEEIYRADERWEKLHSNAVPPLVELMQADYDFRETKQVKALRLAQSKAHYVSDFEF